MLQGRHQFELVGDIGFHGFNPTPYFSRTHASHDFVRRGFERLSSRRLKSRVFSARLYKHSKSRSSFVYRSPLNPQQDPELPAQFHLVEHGLIPAPGHIFLSKAPRHLPEIVSAEERSRTWDVHQVNEAELIVLPMDWLSKKQSGRVVTTAIGLGMANRKALIEHRCASSCSGWCQFLHGLVARQYALREVHSKACRIRPCNALSFTLSACSPLASAPTRIGRTPAKFSSRAALTRGCEQDCSPW